MSNSYLDEVCHNLGIDKISIEPTNKFVEFLSTAPDNIHHMPKEDVVNALWLGSKYFIYLKSELGRIKANKVKLLADFNFRLFSETPKVTIATTLEERKMQVIRKDERVRSLYVEITKADMAIEQISDVAWSIENLCKKLEIVLRNW